MEDGTYRIVRRIVTFATYIIEDADSVEEAEGVIDGGDVDPDDEDVMDETTVRAERFDNGAWVTAEVGAKEEE